MANPVRVPHLVGTNKVVNLEDIYGEIGDVCGISKLDGDVPDDAETYKSVQTLISGGIIRRATVRLSNNKLRSVYMVAANCPKVGALATLEYQAGLTIKTAYFSERITLS